MTFMLLCITGRFVTRVFHPNIHDDGDICLDILQDRWTPSLTTCKVLLSISSLLTDPNPDSPLNDEAAELYMQDRDLYDRQVASFVSKYAS
eukprot:m.151588 g.151588  ORF g.151588 m.151588 type:complete len:91 (-) comp14251_c0_seq7:2759-3031(-)